MPRLAIQLYTLRGRPEPIPGLIREIASHGFEGVEFDDRLLQEDPGQVRATLDGTGLTPIGVHLDLPTIKQRRATIIEQCTAIGCPRVVIPHLPIERFRTRQRADTLAAELRSVAGDLADEEIRLGIHTSRELLLPMYARSAIRPIMASEGLPRGVYNHIAWMGGLGIARDQSCLLTHTPLGQLLEETDAIEFEIDAKSAATAGFPFGGVLETCGNRATLVHLSDVARSRWIPPDYAPVMPGSGVIDVDTVLAASKNVEWVVVEHDDPEDPSIVLEDLSGMLDLPQSNTARTLAT